MTYLAGFIIIGVKGLFHPDQLVAGPASSPSARSGRDRKIQSSLDAAQAELSRDTPPASH